MTSEVKERAQQSSFSSKTQMIDKPNEAQILDEINIINFNRSMKAGERACSIDCALDKRGTAVFTISGGVTSGENPKSEGLEIIKEVDRDPVLKSYQPILYFVYEYDKKVKVYIKGKK